jgi:hypothetical protein
MHNLLQQLGALAILGVPIYIAIMLWDRRNPMVVVDRDSAWTTAEAEVRITDVGNGPLDGPAVSLTLVNRTQELRNFVVTLEVTSPDTETRYADDTVVMLGVRPGQSVVSKTNMLTKSPRGSTLRVSTIATA